MITSVKIGIAIIVLALSNWFTYSHTQEYTSNKYELRISQQREKMANERKEKEDAILESDRLLRKSNEAEKQRVNANFERMLASLRNRATRAEQAASVIAGNGGTCTGAELSKEDGEFLTREAARAETLRSELEGCYLRYENARKLLLK